jgi:hypothetical protein
VQTLAAPWATKPGGTASGCRHYREMPRYHLHLFDDCNVMDLEGAIFPDVEAAQHVANRSARHLMAENVKEGRPLDLSHRIDVADDCGMVVATVSFRNLITIKDSGKSAA